MSQSSSDPNWVEHRMPVRVCEAEPDCDRTPRSGRICDMHRHRKTRTGSYSKDACRVPRYNLPQAEVIRLRRMLGLPVKGPSRKWMIRMSRIENEPS